MLNLNVNANADIKCEQAFMNYVKAKIDTLPYVCIMMALGDSNF